MKSSRCTRAITALRARSQPFHTQAAANDFDERARLALAASDRRAQPEHRLGEVTAHREIDVAVGVGDVSLQADSPGCFVSPSRGY